MMRTERALTTLWPFAVVTTQSALLLMAMMLAFAPFASASTSFGLPQGYLTYLLYPLVLYLLLAAAHRWLNGLPAASLGFTWRDLPRPFALGLGIGVAAVLSIVALAALWQPDISLALIGWPAELSVVAWLLADSLETSVAEEFLVRGFMLPALVRRRIGLHSAVLFSSLLFTLLHIQTWPIWWLLPIMITGLFLSYLYYATASIWAPVGCHLAINLVLGLINRGVLLQAQGLSSHLAELAVIECLVYLALAVLVMQIHQRRVRSGASDFPVQRILSVAGWHGGVSIGRQ